MTQLRTIKPPMPSAQYERVIKIDIRETPQVAIYKKPTPKKEPIQKKLKERKKIAKAKKAPPISKTEPKKVVSATKEVKPQPKKPKVVEPSEILYIPNPIIQQNPAPIKPVVAKTPKIAKLYGNKFDNFTPNQQKFIVKNLNEIQRITQNTLTQRGYPLGALAARTGQEGTNIVSFDLHPNGDISNLKLVKYVGYQALDDNTIETIKSAYKDYPYPTETTKIIFYVEYSIFGY